MSGDDARARVDGEDAYHIQLLRLHLHTHTHDNLSASACQHSIDMSIDLATWCKSSKAHSNRKKCWRLLESAHGAGELQPLDLNPELRERRPTPTSHTAASAAGGPDALGAEEGEDGGGWVPFGDTRVGIVPAPGNINVNLGFFNRRFSTVTDRFSGSWCRFPESCG